MSGKFRDKITFITGATSGIGKCIAEYVLAQDGVVIGSYRNEEVAKREMLRLKDSGRYCLIKADVTNENDIKRAFEEVLSRFGRIDYLINNAGDCMRADLTDGSAAEYLFKLNCVGKMLCTKYALPLLKASPSARIVSICSRSSLVYSSELAAYCLSQVAALAYSQYSAKELAPYNFKVNSICPSLTDTPLAKRIYSDKEIEDYKKKFGGLLTADYVAEAVCKILTGETPSENGQNFCLFNN